MHSGAPPKGRPERLDIVCSEVTQGVHAVAQQQQFVAIEPEKDAQVPGGVSGVGSSLTAPSAVRSQLLAKLSKGPESKSTGVIVRIGASDGW